MTPALYPVQVDLPGPPFESTQTENPASRADTATQPGGSAADYEDIE